MVNVYKPGRDIFDKEREVKITPVLLTVLGTMENGQKLPRGKRRGDDQVLAAWRGGDNGFSLSGFCNGNGQLGDGCLVTESKRQCLGLSEIHPFPLCNNLPDVTHSNGFPHARLRDHTENGLNSVDDVMQTGHPELQMEHSSVEDMATPNGHHHITNGFHHHKSEADPFLHQHQFGSKGIPGGGGEGDGGNSGAPFISNGYYGYIANYEPASNPKDAEEEDGMDMNYIGQAEYAINGPPTCIEPKERRVCSRCSAGEAGHITHIIQDVYR